MAEELKNRYDTDTFKTEFKEVATLNVNLNDVFSLKYLYMLMHEWLIEEGYCDRKDENFKETLYLQKEDAQGIKEHWFHWRLDKTPWKNKFWKYVLDINAHTLGIQQVETMHNGKKLKADKGEIEVTIDAYLVIDYQQVWWGKNATNPLFKALAQPLLNRFLKKRFTTHKNQLKEDAYKLKQAIESYFMLPNVLPERELDQVWQRRLPE